MDTIQIIISITTIAMSGVTSGIVTFYLNARRDSRQLRRQKLEAVYESFSGFTTQLGSYWIPYISVMANKIEYNKALDMTINKNSTEAKYFQTLEMLIAIYFPSLQCYLDELIDIRSSANHVIYQHKEDYKTVGPHESPSLAVMQTLSKTLTKIEERFREAVRIEANRINKKIPGGE